MHIYIGCEKKAEVSKSEATKRISPEQINVNFTWKDDYLNDLDNFYPVLSINSEWGTEMIPGVTIEPVGGTLGLIFKAEGNQWTVGDLYHLCLDICYCWILQSNQLTICYI